MTNLTNRIPRLNMAIPRPASDRREIDLAITAGISTFHLQRHRYKKLQLQSTRKGSMLEYISEDDYCILERDQRPGEANEARVSVWIPNKFAPDHYEDESGHYASRGHRCGLRFTISRSLGIKLGRGA